MLQAPVLMNWMSTLTAATVAAAKVPLLDPLSGSTTPPVWMTWTSRVLEEAGHHVEVVGEHGEVRPLGEVRNHRLAGGPSVQVDHHPVL